ncbi:PmoA family protein [Pelagicoccus enzymogenes]|nr:PmoA family protein [Pelagicoccus enzymogenes]
MSPVHGELREVSFERVPEGLAIRIDGDLFGIYSKPSDEIPRPFLSQVSAPNGVQVTRNHPPLEGIDSMDHATFHPGLWLSFAGINGNDYWRLKKRMEHGGFVGKPTVREGVGMFSVRNHYLETLEKGGKRIAEELTTYRIFPRPEYTLLCMETTIHSDSQDLVFGDDQEYGLGVRVRTDLEERHGGRVQTSAGAHGSKDAYGTAPVWVDYGGELDGEQVGALLMPDPANFRASWLHVRDYGLMAANPFGRRKVAGGEESRLVVKKGERFTLGFGLAVYSMAKDAPLDQSMVYEDFLSVMKTQDPREETEDVSSDLPSVPEGFEVELYAKEPLIRNPGAMAFDRRGRLFVGYGPQYRSPKPDTPGDSVAVLLDMNGDGIADTSKVFATGFNNVQGLSWHGDDLWVSNSPDLTVVRDLDGDDVADEYVRVYTDLGNLEHGNHGHSWAPDGKFYFSQGTSKGLTSPGRVAPKPFRELWGVDAPAGVPDFPPPQVYRAEDYEAVYQDPRDDWGREGGFLRSDDMGANLEIVARGMRNAWDIGFDSGFNWFGTDNDQSEGDRLIMPFYNAHFGWGHSWSSHWTGENHLPTAPTSGPVFDGSGTGVVFYDAEHFPEDYRGVWFVNDWLRKTTFVYRPVWEGALLKPKGGRWEPFIVGGGGAQAAEAYGGGSDSAPQVGALYRPTDIAVGPDGSLYVAGWGSGLGVRFENGQQTNEGRIFRISAVDAPEIDWELPKRQRSVADWTFAELFEDLGSALPVWNIDAQDELVRRGGQVRSELIERLERGALSEAAETWAIWTLGRISPSDISIEDWLEESGRDLSFNARIQAIRIAGYRAGLRGEDPGLPGYVEEALEGTEARIRFAAIQAIVESGQRGLADVLIERAAVESDRVCFYAIWQGLRDLLGENELKGLLADARPGVRRAAMLALFESQALEEEKVRVLMKDSDGSNADLAARWVAKQSGNELIDLYPEPGVFVDSIQIKITPGIKPARVRYTVDGSEPTRDSRTGSPGRIDKTTTLKVALFVDGEKVGNTLESEYRKSEHRIEMPVLAALTKTTKAEDVLPLLGTGDASKGPGLFTAAGCVACHKAGDLGVTIGPDLSSIGDRGDADGIVRSILSPNQIVVEGYSLLTIATKDGSAYAGILESESDRFVNLVQLDAQSVAIEKSEIVSRNSMHSSPMPAYGSVLSPEQVADLVEWLMELRAL